jgi:hypothetical protein
VASDAVAQEESVRWLVFVLLAGCDNYYCQDSINELSPLSTRQSCTPGAHGSVRIVGTRTFFVCTCGKMPPDMSTDDRPKVFR